jgi:hypothetical protein
MGLPESTHDTRDASGIDINDLDRRPMRDEQLSGGWIHCQVVRVTKTSNDPRLLDEEWAGRQVRRRRRNGCLLRNGSCVIDDSDAHE